MKRIKTIIKICKNEKNFFFISARYFWDRKKKIQKRKEKGTRRIRSNWFMLEDNHIENNDWY